MGNKHVHSRGCRTFFHLLPSLVIEEPRVNKTTNQNHEKPFATVVKRQSFSVGCLPQTDPPLTLHPMLGKADPIVAELTSPDISGSLRVKKTSGGFRKLNQKAAALLVLLPKDCALERYQIDTSQKLPIQHSLFSRIQNFSQHLLPLFRLYKSLVVGCRLVVCPWQLPPPP